MTDRFYVPVGSKLTPRDFQGISLRDMEQRSVYDDRYAGYDPGFRWQDHIAVDPNMQPADLRAKILGTLEQFSRTEEGQHVLRQAHAMQYFREHGTLPPAGGSPESKIRVSFNPNEPGTYFERGVLNIDWNDIANIEYVGVDGRRYDISVQNVLFHELSHAMDGLLTAQNRAAWTFYRENSLGLTPLGPRDPDPAKEGPAIIATNFFMGAYYQETARQGYLGYREANPYQITQDNLGPDHYYNDFEVPSVPRGDSGTRYR